VLWDYIGQASRRYRRTRNDVLGGFVAL
jgi:hypothetical protein